MELEEKIRGLQVKMHFVLYNAEKRRQFKKENRALKGKPKPVVFFGDSITDFCDLKRYYPEIHAVNRGISGNTTRDMLNRIKLSVYDTEPSEVVLLAGINDMMNEKESPSMVIPRYEKIVQGIRQNCPGAKIVCQSVYPGWNGDKEKADRGMTFPLEYLAEDIIKLNRLIQGICGKYHCTYADIHSCLKQDDNTMIHDYSFDGCHPNADGYKVIAAELKKYL